MSRITGTVKRLFERPYGDKTMRSFCVEEDDRVFGTGAFKHPSVNVGNRISFEVEKNQKGFWNAITKTIEEAQQAPSQAPAAPQAPIAVGYAAPKTDWALKDKIIELQACRNTAVAFVSVLMQHSLIKVPTKKDEQFDFALNLVNELTDQFVQSNTNLREGKPVREVPKEAEVDPDAPEAAGTADEWQE
jgi:hypothetical protein